MKPCRRVLAAAVALLVLSHVTPCAVAGEQVIEPRFRHIRHGRAREWSDFPNKPESSELVVAFEAPANQVERAMRLRHRGLRQDWVVRLNDRQVAKLAQGDDETVTYLAVPPGALRDGANALRVACTAKPEVSDDVMLGDVALLDRPVAAALSEATLDVTVTEGDAATEVPCRVTIADARGGLVTFGTKSDDRLAVRPGVVYTRDGKARVALPAGRYTVYAGRGFEYSLASATVDARAGETAGAKLSIRRVVPTPGYVACDPHVHTQTYSRHGDATAHERALTLAGEGVELAVATDHNLQVNLAPALEAAGVGRHVTTVVGNEVTTASSGHFNVFPVPQDGPLINWRVRLWESVAREVARVAGPADAPGGPVVILNHARDVHGGFRPFDPSRHVSFAGEDLDGWTLPANAMEIVNSGATLTEPALLYLDWFGMLNRGHRLTPIAASDSHDVARYIVGQGRTYVRCADEEPGRVDVDRARRSLREGRVLVSYGLLTEIKVGGRFEPGDLVPPPAGGDELTIEVRVLGPEWTRVNEVTLFVNGIPTGGTQFVGAGRGEPQPAGVKSRHTWRMPRPRHDVHLVAVARGPGVTGPWWPSARPYQQTSPEWSPYVLGSTGPVWVDADGSGQFNSAFEYATRLLQRTGDDVPAALAKLADFDAAVAVQAASVLRTRLGDRFEGAVVTALKGAVADPTRRGIERYLRAWRQSAAARKARATAPAR